MQRTVAFSVTPDGAKENPPEGGFLAERSGFEPEKELSPLTGLARHHANRPTPKPTKHLGRTMHAIVPTVVPSSFQRIFLLSAMRIERLTRCGQTGLRSLGSFFLVYTRVPV